MRVLGDLHPVVDGGARLRPLWRDCAAECRRSADGSSRSPSTWSSAPSMPSHQAVLRWDAVVKEDLGVSDSHQLLPALQDDLQGGGVCGKDSMAVGWLF